jgi:hypothetical protein
MPKTARSIKLAVGRSGVNVRDDVKIIQQLLNQAIATNKKLANAHLEKLKVDGVCGARTNEAIEKFQQLVLGWSGRAVDGTVQPNRQTWKALNGNVDSLVRIKPAHTEPSMWVGGYAMFRQGNYKQKLGDSTTGTIAAYGCALCSLTMAATCIGSATEYWPEDLKPRELTPLKSNEILRKAGVFNGYALVMKKAANALGMEFDEYGRAGDLTANDVRLIDAHLNRGYPIAAHVDYKRDAVGDHWILVIARYGNGKFTAIDPAYGKTMQLTRGDNQTVNNPRYNEIKDERQGVLFGWSGSGGSSAQEKYVVVRFALLSPAGAGFLCQ